MAAAPTSGSGLEVMADGNRRLQGGGARRSPGYKPRPGQSGVVGRQAGSGGGGEARPEAERRRGRQVAASRRSQGGARGRAASNGRQASASMILLHSGLVCTRRTARLKAERRHVRQETRRRRTAWPGAERRLRASGYCFEANARNREGQDFKAEAEGLVRSKTGRRHHFGDVDDRY